MMGITSGINGEMWIYDGTTGRPKWSSTIPTALLDPITLDPANDRVGINNVSPSATLHVVNEVNSVSAIFDIYSGGSSTAIAAIPVRMRTARGTSGSPAATGSGDAIGGITGLGHTGTAFVTSSKATISMVAAEAWTTTANGTVIRFSTTPIGSTSISERMRITDAGYVGIGSTSPSEMLHVAGNAYSTATIYNPGCGMLYNATDGSACFGTLVVAGENLSKGEIVYIKQAGGADGKVWKTPTSNEMPVGIVYADAVADASVWVVVVGKCMVLPESGVTVTRGYVAYTSASEAGRAAQSATVPSAVDHFREIGHFLKTGSGNGAATLAIVHFN